MLVISVFFLAISASPTSRAGVESGIPKSSGVNLKRTVSTVRRERGRESEREGGREGGREGARARVPEREKEEEEEQQQQGI